MPVEPGMAHNTIMGQPGPTKVTGDPAGMAKTIYEKYGGFSAISKIVMDLYDRLLDDDEVGPFFDNVEMNRIIDHQTKFVSSLIGGPASYTDAQIEKMHAHLDIGPLHFEKLKDLLGATLADHGLSPEDVGTVIGEFEKRRNLVTDKSDVD